MTHTHADKYTQKQKWFAYKIQLSTSNFQYDVPSWFPSVDTHSHTNHVSVIFFFEGNEMKFEMKAIITMPGKVKAIYCQLNRLKDC